jgi:replicative DNA helicase
MVTSGFTKKDITNDLEIKYQGGAIFTRGVNRERLAKVATALKSKKLMHLAESDLYWDEISSIVPLDIEEVYDATVPGTHNLVANDILLHNSIEQDADVVMFIHREDKNNPESDRQNIAEILIEKHRNGPTGRVELIFDEKRTSFQSMDKSGYGELGAEF